MQLDPTLQPTADNYKLLTNLVVPRPIAWVTSLNQSGVVNLAPFSFFNAVGSNPLYIVISIGQNDSGQPKDTGNNIRASSEFVVNLVTEELFAAMNISAADFPPDQSELEATQLHTAPSVRVKTPRVAKTQASLECKLFIGEVVMFHVADHLLGPRLHINNFAPIGRLGSPSVYCRTTDRFDIARVSFAQLKSANKPTSNP
jgi:flavin reductase (DIM6/NTAB) family NADH-FMN oxidoreductase RutF